MIEPTPWLVYLLRCGDGSLYCGVTNDLPRRLAAHESGRGARYTRGRLPLHVIFVDEVGARGDALRAEAAWKRMSRREKLALTGATSASAAASPDFPRRRRRRARRA